MQHGLMVVPHMCWQHHLTPCCWGFLIGGQWPVGRATTRGHSVDAQPSGCSTCGWQHAHRMHSACTIQDSQPAMKAPITCVAPAMRMWKCPCRMLSKMVKLLILNLKILPVKLTAFHPPRLLIVFSVYLVLLPCTHFLVALVCAMSWTAGWCMRIRLLGEWLFPKEIRAEISIDLIKLTC